MSEEGASLSTDDLLVLAVALFGDPPPVRDLGLLSAAAARPQATAFGEDCYPDRWRKAAALLHSTVRNHALVDGNKRLGWTAAAVQLELWGVDTARATNDQVVELVMRVASGEVDDVDALAAELRAILDPS